MKTILAKLTGKLFKAAAIFIVIVAASLIAFYIFNPGKAVRLVFPDLNRINYINANIRNDSAYTKLSVILENKNPYKLVIDTFTYDLLLNDSSIAYQKVGLNLDQTKFDIDTVKLPLNLSIKKIQRLIRGIQEDSAKFTAQGYVVYQTIFGRVKLDYNKTSKISTPVPPKIKVLRVERKDFSFRNKILKAEATIRITNEGKVLDLQLSGIRYDLKVNNTLHSHGTVDKVIRIKPGTSVTLIIPMDIEVYRPLKTAWLIRIDNDRLPYTLKLTGLIKENISENAFNSPTEITATGMLELKK